MDEAFRALLKQLGSDSQGITVHPHFQGLEFSEERFRRISSAKGSVAFVDGGSAELAEAPNFSLHRIRLAGVVLKNGKRLSRKEEFSVLVTAKDNSWIVQCFPDNRFSGVRFGWQELTLREGNSHVKASKVCEAVRRMAELDFLCRFSTSVSADLFVLDGSLETSFVGEESFMQALTEKPIVGLSKTSRLFTSDGQDVAGLLMTKRSESWLYHPLWESKGVFETALVKLHPKSKHVFRFDCWKGSDLEKYVGLLAEQSNDPVFLGYPYGLIVVDQLARISNEEREFLVMKCKTEAGKSWSLIEKSVRSLDAHSILDAIR